MERDLQNARFVTAHLAFFFLELHWNYTNADLEIHRVFKLSTGEVCIFLKKKSIL